MMRLPRAMLGTHPKGADVAKEWTQTAMNGTKRA